MSITNKLKERLLAPKSPSGRMTNILILIIISAGSIGAFFIIKYIICNDHLCTGNNLLNIINSLSPFYLIYGIACLIIARFITKYKTLASVYIDSIILVAMIGFIMMAILVFSVKQGAYS